MRSWKVFWWRACGHIRAVRSVVRQVVKGWQRVHVMAFRPGEYLMDSLHPDFKPKDCVMLHIYFTNEDEWVDHVIGKGLRIVSLIECARVNELGVGTVTLDEKESR